MGSPSEGSARAYDQGGDSSPLACDCACVCVDPMFLMTAILIVVVLAPPKWSIRIGIDRHTRIGYRTYNEDSCRRE